jgi:hypothetical protein
MHEMGFEWFVDFLVMPRLWQMQVLAHLIGATHEETNTPV